MPNSHPQSTQKIVPHLWFDTEARDAAAFYVSVFGDLPQVRSVLGTVTTLTGTPSGDADIVPFTLWGYHVLSISAGPYFKPTPAISFMVNFDPSQDPDAVKRIDEMWARLSDGGKIMMPIGEYPFSKRYGWCADKYGFSWQLILTNPEGEPRPRIIPSLLYVTESGKIAEEATDYYLSVFKNARRGTIMRYPAGPPAGGGSNAEGAVMFTDFTLENQWFTAMDGLASMHAFNFNEAVSLIVYCDDQAEIDYYWEMLSAVPESEQCGWLKDKFGVSWQIVPKLMDDMMATQDAAALKRVTDAFLKMKKFNIAELEKAYKG